MCLWQKSGSREDQTLKKQRHACKPLPKHFRLSCSMASNSYVISVGSSILFQIINPPPISWPHLPICRPRGPRQILLPNGCWPVGRIESPDILPMQPGSTPYMHAVRFGGQVAARGIKDSFLWMGLGEKKSPGNKVFTAKYGISGRVS